LVHYQPATETELSEIIRDTKYGLALTGSGSKTSLGHAGAAVNGVSLSRFSGVLVYEPEELILEAGPATPLDDIEKLIDQRGQMLAFEPPHYRVLFGATSTGTLGGLLNCNLSGPRRLTAGAARDHVLGVQGVDGRGTIFKGGGRVVKNVTGYDMPKLIAGSYGTLAAVTSVVFKVLPKPETEVTLVVPVDAPAVAVQIMSQAVGTPYAVSCAAYVPDRGVCLRLEGIPSSVAVRKEQLSKAIELPVEILDEQASRLQWHSVRELSPLKKETVVWKVSTALSNAPVLLQKLHDVMDFSFIMDWAGGLLWIATARTDINVRDHMNSGHAMLFKAPDDMKARTPVFHPQAPALAALSARVKSAFDPERKLNPGRMHKDL
jgi:glycolate oxidase FAD binding subunit